MQVLNYGLGFFSILYLSCLVYCLSNISLALFVAAVHIVLSDEIRSSDLDNVERFLQEFYAQLYGNDIDL